MRDKVRSIFNQYQDGCIARDEAILNISYEVLQEHLLRGLSVEGVLEIVEALIPEVQ